MNDREEWRERVRDVRATTRYDDDDDDVYFTYMCIMGMLQEDPAKCSLTSEKELLIRWILLFQRSIKGK